MSEPTPGRYLVIRRLSDGGIVDWLNVTKFDDFGADAAKHRMISAMDKTRCYLSDEDEDEKPWQHR